MPAQNTPESLFSTQSFERAKSPKTFLFIACLFLGLSLLNLIYFGDIVAGLELLIVGFIMHLIFSNNSFNSFYFFNDVIVFERYHLYPFFKSYFIFEGSQITSLYFSRGFRGTGSYLFIHHADGKIKKIFKAAIQPAGKKLIDEFAGRNKISQKLNVNKMRAFKY